MGICTDCRAYLYRLSGVDFPIMKADRAALGTDLRFRWILEEGILFATAMIGPGHPIHRLIAEQLPGRDRGTGPFGRRGGFPLLSDTVPRWALSPR
jgi:hypothetical protein